MDLNETLKKYGSLLNQSNDLYRQAQSLLENYAIEHCAIKAGDNVTIDGKLALVKSVRLSEFLGMNEKEEYVLSVIPLKKDGTTKRKSRFDSLYGQDVRYYPSAIPERQRIFKKE